MPTPAPKKRAVRPAAERAVEAQARLQIAKADLERQYVRYVQEKLPGVLGRASRRKGPQATSGYYENAGTSRLRTTKRLAPRAPWALLDKSTRDTLRRDVQQTERNNVLCRGIINRYVDFIVGDGPTFKPNSADPEWNKQAKKLVTAWMEGADPLTVGRPNLRGMTTFVDDLRELVRAARLVDGDQLVVFTTDTAGFGTLQYIEAERLQNRAQAYADTAGMCGGVEMDGTGRPVAYHVAGWSNQGTTLESGTYRVDAKHAALMFNPVGFKSNQVRGEPQLQAALDLLDVLNGYIENTSLAAEVATYFGVIFKTEKPADFNAVVSSAVVDQPDRDNDSQPQECVIGPAFTYTCKPNEGPVQMKPEFPTTNFKDFVHALIQIIGADVGLPLVLLLYVTEQMSWSNLRGVLAIADRGFNYTQDWLRRFVCRVVRWKLEEFIERGLLARVEGWDSFHVGLPMSPAIDFKTEVEGFKLAVDNNWMTDQDVCERLGTGTFEEIVTARGENRKLMEAANVLPPTMPGAGVPGGNKPEKPEPPEKEETE